MRSFLRFCVLGVLTHAPTFAAAQQFSNYDPIYRDRNIGRVYQTADVPNVKGDNEGAWKFKISTGIEYDSNVNNGTKRFGSLSNGVFIPTSLSSKAFSDTALTVKIDVTQLYRFSRIFSWYTTASVSRRELLNTQKFDATGGVIDTGLLYQPFKELTIYAPLFASLGQNEGSRQRLIREFGVRPNARYSINDKVDIGLSSSISHKEYVGQNKRDATAYSFGPFIEIKPWTDASFTTNLSGLKEYTSLCALSTQGYSVSLVYRQKIAENLNGTGLISRSISRGSCVDINTAIRKRDTSSSLRYDVAYTIKSSNQILNDLDVVAGYAYTVNESSNKSSQYKKSALNFGIQKSF